MPTVQLPADMPPRMRQLPLDDVGRPIPFFVAEFNGVPDFRVTSAEKMVAAIRQQLCWTCGQRLLRVRGSTSPRGTFVAGPMCLINRTSAEPPNHADCAEWSSRACPFLTKPAKVRRDGNMPEVTESPGIMLDRNPGVTALIASLRWQVWNPKQETGIGGDGLLFEFGRIENVTWMAQGRLARREEVLGSIESGLPTLVEMAETEVGAMPHLANKLRDAMRWIGPGSVDDYPTIRATLEQAR